MEPSGLVLEPSWSHLSPLLSTQRRHMREPGLLGATGAPPGPSWIQNWPYLAVLEPWSAWLRGRFRPRSGATCVNLGSWRPPGLSWSHLSAIWARLGALQGHLGSRIGRIGPSWSSGGPGCVDDFVHAAAPHAMLWYPDGRPEVTPCYAMRSRMGGPRSCDVVLCESDGHSKVMRRMDIAPHV